MTSWHQWTTSQTILTSIRNTWCRPQSNTILLLLQQSLHFCFSSRRRGFNIKKPHIFRHSTLITQQPSKMQTRIRLYLIIKILFTSGLFEALIKESLVMRIECTFGYFSKAPFTYVNRYQKALAKMLVKRQTPGFSVTIHVWNILLYCFIIQPQPNTIIIVDLWETSNKNEPCPPVTVL